MINVLKLALALCFVISPVVYAETDVDLRKEELPFPFVQVPADKAFAEFLRLQQVEKERTPILLGTPDTIRKYRFGTFTDNESVEETLKKANKIDINKWLSVRATEYELDQLPTGKWPNEVAPVLDANVHQMFWVGDDPKVVIALLPTTKPWEIFAHLNWGGWNSNPLPEEHVALFKHWYEKYKAVPVSIAGDAIEVMVQSVPDTKGQALELAKEQAIYNTELIYQGEETLQALAGSLINQKVWLFWWD